MYASDGTPLATSVQWAPAPKAPVQLRPGAKAYFVLQYATQTGYGNLSCPTSAALEVTPPNDYGHLVLTGAAGRLQPYGGTFENLECGQIHVKPVTATPGD